MVTAPRSRRRQIAVLVLLLSLLFLAVSCGEPVPFNINLLLLLPQDPVQGTLPIGGTVELPAGADTNLGAFTWQIPLHDLRQSVNLDSSLPDSGIVEASLTVGLATGTVPEVSPIVVTAAAELSVYVAPAGEELWVATNRSGAQSVELFAADPAVVTLPLTEAQISTLSAPFVIGVELNAAELVVASNASDSLQLDALSYSFGTLRIEGLSGPAVLF